MLSFIIPFYGGANRKLLDRCILSIHNQNLATDRYEIIVADEEGKGLGGARNNGVRQAKGEYILFVDADDYLFYNSLQQLIGLLEEHRPDMLSFEFKVTKNVVQLVTDNLIDGYKVYESGANYMLFHNFMGTAWRHIYRREWLNQNQLTFAEGVYHEDEAFVAKAYCLAGKTIISNRVLYAYVQTPQSILNNRNREQRKKRLNDFEDQILNLKAFMMTPLGDTQRKALLRRVHFLTIDYLVQIYRNRIGVNDTRKRIIHLKKHGFLPLPNAGYSNKYTLAQTVINLISKAG